ncbi:Cell wall surface anchor family protein [Lactococcus cremoris]|nr:Cell wall surface anchor family protein [Lactococcus cremoris]
MKLSKKIVALGAVVTLGVVGGVSTAHASASTSNAMYRVYNPNSGEHFYTKSAYEKSVLVKTGWRYEGIGWNAPTSGSAVYRVYNPNSGEHFYTKSAYEKSVLVGRGWRYEGIGWYTANSGTPLYRVYNPNSGEHFYTKDSYEKSSLVSRGWCYEGIAWYGATASQTTKPTQPTKPAQKYQYVAWVSVDGVRKYQKTFDTLKEANEWGDKTKDSQEVVNLLLAGHSIRYGVYPIDKK